jgi:hypothetical protein
MRRYALPSSEAGRYVIPEPYSESSFRYFLALDRRRAERWNRSLLLVLAALRGVGGSSRLTPRQASVLFAALGASLRDIDFVGWYKQDRMIAGVLAQAVKVPPDVPRSIAQRISTALRERLSAEDAGRLRVHVVTLGGARTQANL